MTMRDYQAEYEGRVAFIKELVRKSGVSGLVFGNSGGKDSALVGILCKAACPDTVGLIMPCASRRNFGMDRDDGLEVARVVRPWGTAELSAALAELDATLPA